MYEYKIEMFQNGKWKRAKFPFGGIVGESTDINFIARTLNELKEKWKKENSILDIPTEYRVKKRFVSEWEIDQ